MDIYCINLDNRTDRWEQVKSIFSEFTNIKLHRFSAVMHEHGWLGCSLSHMICLREHMKNNDFLIIIEDDCMITSKKTFFKNFTNLITWLTHNKEKWDIFNGNPTAARCDGIILDKDLRIINLEFGKTSNFIIYNNSEKIRAQCGEYHELLINLKNINININDHDHDHLIID